MVGIEIIIGMDRAKRFEFMQTFERLTRPEDRKETCLEQGLFEQIGWGNRLFWLERWTSRGPMEERMASESYTALLGAAEVLGAIEDIRTVEFSPASHTSEPKLPQS